MLLLILLGALGLGCLLLLLLGKELELFLLLTFLEEFGIGSGLKLLHERLELVDLEGEDAEEVLRLHFSDTFDLSREVLVCDHSTQETQFALPEVHVLELLRFLKHAPKTYFWYSLLF